jgi:hypothetical protein
MKVLFVGPSLAKDRERLREAERTLVMAGPVSWGDVARATQAGATAIGIVDGRFEDTRSTWHKEILFALSSGVAVAGAASMGALRAVECCAFGMIGIGKIFARFASGELVDDADVAQIHAPSELGYFPLSEPWVNIEPTLERMASAGIMGARDLETAKATARKLHFKLRTYHNIFAPICRNSGRLGELLKGSVTYAVDQKRIDALELTDWLIASRDCRRSRPADWVFSETSHWQAVCEKLLSRTLPPSPDAIKASGPAQS